jgi:hypothetical protein
MLNIGPLYVTLVKYPHRNFLPIAEKGWSHEIDEPFRRGSCLVIRLPFTHPGIGIGIWGKPQDETDALTAAIWGRQLDISVDELLEWD